MQNNLGKCLGIFSKPSGDRHEDAATVVHNPLLQRVGTRGRAGTGAPPLRTVGTGVLLIILSATGLPLKAHADSPPTWQEVPTAPTGNSWSELQQPSSPAPQWGEIPQGSSNSLPQWSEFAAPADDSDSLVAKEGYLPHTTPTPLAPQPQREILAETPGETQPTGESPVAPSPQSSPVEPTTTPVESSPAKKPESVAAETVPPVSPLADVAPGQPNARHLKQGDVTLNLYTRFFFIPNSVDRNATGAYPGFGVTWAISDTLELTLQGQFVDSGGPYKQDGFITNRQATENSAKGEGVLEVKQQLWQQANLGFSGVFSLDWADGGYRFLNPQTLQTVANDKNPTLVPALKFPFTAKLDDRWLLTFSPTVAFFPESSALFLFRAPLENPGSFGTTLGFTGAFSYQLSPRVFIWGDAFVPVTGANSIQRDSGRAVRTVAYNAGIRYLVNPRVALDVFASNALGSKGALSLTADRDYMALGLAVTVMPDFIAANRRYSDSFSGEFAGKDTPVKPYGLGMFEQGILNGGQFGFGLRGGSNSIFTALNYGLLKDVEVGIYLNYTFSKIDEGEQGLSGRLRLLNQAEGDPVTLNFAATYSQTNEPFVNFYSNNRNAAKILGLSPSFPSVLSPDNLSRGNLKLITVSLPLTYEFQGGAALWLTPIWGYVQRQSTQIAGFNFGGLLPLGNNFSFIAEVGKNFAGEGNAFIGQVRRDAIPWTAALRYDISRIFGLGKNSSLNPSSYIELYVTNRVGFTPWLQMRVLDQNDTAVGGGFSISF